MWQIIRKRSSFHGVDEGRNHMEKVVYKLGREKGLSRQVS
jgi:hypothetical protein